MSKSSIRWLEEPESHNYPAALSYLSLIYRTKEAKAVVKRLGVAGVVNYKAKDIFRASRLSLLGVSNSHVERDRMKIMKGERLSPILLVRDAVHGRVVIADGYHRLCAIYSFDEDAIIRCKICALLVSPD
jgi:predicted nucleic acid-binding protein